LAQLPERLLQLWGARLLSELYRQAFLESFSTAAASSTTDGFGPWQKLPEKQAYSSSF